MAILAVLAAGLALAVMTSVAAAQTATQSFCGYAAAASCHLKMDFPTDGVKERSRVPDGFANVSVTSFGTMLPTCVNEPYVVLPGPRPISVYVNFTDFNDASGTDCLTVLFEEALWLTNFTLEAYHVVTTPVPLNLRLAAGAFEVILTPC